MATKMLRGYVTIWAAYPEAFANPAEPTAAEINNEDLVFNISCAIEDSYTLNMVGSDTDDSISICDIGDVQTPTFQNYEASLDGFRDEDRSEEHTSELQSRGHLVCRLLLEKQKQVKKK